MVPTKTVGLAVLLFILLVGYTCCYTINEGQQGLILRLGQLKIDSKTKKPIVNGPGLHFKWPFINQVRIFDSRLQTLDIKSSQLVTIDQKSVIVDYYIKWRISDLPLYFMRTGGSPKQAQNLLEPQLNDGLRAEFGRRTITDVVSAERTNIMDMLQAQANKTGEGLGIRVVDVRIKGIEFPEAVRPAIFDQMRAAREKVASEHRARGKSLAETIRAKADANATVILAKAKADAAKLRGEGDAEAARISAESYSQDPSFYSFYRSLSAYKAIFTSKQDVLVLQPDSQFFRYFNDKQAKP
jgi:modulator of FtsH protease HflC